MLRGSPGPNAPWGGQRHRTPRECMARGGAESPVTTPTCVPCTEPGRQRESLQLPTVAVGPRGHRHLQRGLQGDQPRIGTGQPDGRLVPIQGAAAFPELFSRLGLADSLAPGKVISGAGSARFPGGFRSWAGTTAVGGGGGWRCSGVCDLRLGSIRGKASQALPLLHRGQASRHRKGFEAIEVVWVSRSRRAGGGREGEILISSPQMKTLFAKK